MTMIDPAIVPQRTLYTGAKLPAVGMGTFGSDHADADAVSAAVAGAIRVGYRSFDCAACYGNEDMIGQVFADAFAEGVVKREDLFIASKVWNDMHGDGDVLIACAKTLKDLKLDYLDLYLIHWPVPGCYTGTWLEMAKLLETGRVLSIGVSNFQIHHLEELKKISGIVPAVNQIECHPLCYPKELIEYCQSEGIQVQAYAPLARGAYLDNDVMCVLGTKYAHTPAQVGLRWAIQKGISVIPKSVNPDRIASNANIFDFNIEDEDMAIMDTLNEDLHTSHVPDDLKDVIF